MTVAQVLKAARNAQLEARNAAILRQAEAAAQLAAAKAAEQQHRAAALIQVRSFLASVVICPPAPYS
jgi:hypothetical protein